MTGAAGRGERGETAPARGASHLALYRSWRPTRFADVVGQGHVTRTLRNALAAGRVAHAYLLCGPRGTGKTSVAKILARAVNCSTPEAGEPCGRCDPCRAVASGRALDVLEIDAASHRGIEEIRDLREKVRYSPAALQRKVYIIDEVHMLTPEAFNALLKTLEEPPPHAIFVLATTDPHKVPATIVSRCQRFDFHRLTQEEIAGRLREVCDSLGVGAGEDVLAEIARHAEGGLRDALSLLDQCLAFAGDELSVDHLRQLLGVAGRDELIAVVRGLIDGDALAVLAAVDRVHRQGKDLRQFVRDLVALLRDVLFAQVAPGASEPGRALVEVEGVEELVGRLPPARLVELLQSLSRLDGDLRWAAQPRLCLEIGLLGLLIGGGPLAGADGRGPAEMAVAKPAARLTEGRRAREETAAAAPAPPPAAPAARPNPPPRPEPARAGETGGAAGLAAGPSAASAAAAPTLAQVEAAWPAIRERVKKGRRPLLYALLEPARPAAVEGRRLVLAFRREFGFHRERVLEAENRRFLEQIVRETLGCELSIQCTLMEGPPAGEAGAGSAGAAGDAELEALLQEFGGQVVDLDSEVRGV